MRRLFLAVAALLSLGVSSAFAQSYSHEAPPRASHQQGPAQ
jgi:hypothetical protein